MARYPVFLKSEPLIWGMSLSDILKLTVLMFCLSLMKVPEYWVLILIVVFYVCLQARRKLFPKRYFEFQLSKKDILPLHLMLTNKKVNLK